ncbi:hypothetical protein [Streptomyces sp. NPDC006355]|uniref:hypothetical protein n=1 Tax=Streptomyces sp. NPDC006355 TaxID=3156758 RepID=UPI0033A79188
MSYRPRPNAARAAHQIRRAASVARCRICRHPVHAHRLVDGVRVCTRSRDGGPPSCQECARLLEEFPLTAGMAEFVRAWSTPPSGPPELVGAAVYRD